MITNFAYEKILLEKNFKRPFSEILSRKGNKMIK
jgi:hypothetical protein